MSCSLPIRALVVLAAMGAGAAMGQMPANGAPGAVPSRFPANQPTSLPAGVPGTGEAGQASSGVPVTSKPVTKLDVDFVDGKLTVNAANASLNQVLRQVAQKTGMKVTGTVAEESVFGQYGPSPVSEVLASLLEGTGSNMLLLDNKNGPAELILTPRRGGVTPPNPNAAYANSRGQDDSEQQQYVPPVRPFQAPTITGRGPIGANPDGSPAFGQPTGFGPGGAPTAGDQQQRTPQQIYEQLQSQGGQQQQPAPQE